MASLDALNKQRYPIGRRHTRNRTSYGTMHNWLHSELSGHTLSTYKDPESRLVSKAAAPAESPGLPSLGFVLATQRGCQTVPEEEEAATVRLASPGGVMADYPHYRQLRACMSERDRNRHGVNYDGEEAGAAVAGDRWVKLPILPSPRPHDQNPPVHLQYGPRGAGYDDAHKAYLKQSQAAGNAYGQPKLRNGKGGSTWRHLKFALQPDGKRRQFLDGQVSLSDAHRRQLALRPELREQHQIQLQRADEASERLRRNQYDVNRRPTAKRGMEYNNWLVMR